ncbi:PREDICTED: CD44 antigen isoform X9 [Chinchilla lanigera]|uniref:CD44 antigen isoform X9 n=1 Tax=Chinchilla lanigera TaxID=34839 RepID=UPI00038EDD14|nr:PREDICTED: CD44 antigen isoform X9 [Chinchilla lanigera]
MDKFWWRAAWGLCLVQLSLAQIDLNITCRYAGVFHVEKNGRYSISRTEAADLCKAFNSTLPTMAQMEQALRKGFETCRYGFIEGHVVIPRITPNAICAANNTGVYILTSNTSHYDTYCFNASAPLDKEDCASVTDLPNSFAGQVTITIVNRDGTRYSKKGEYRTHQEDINPNSTIDDDVSGGYPGERSTSGGYSIFHTHLPTSHPTPEEAITEVYGSTNRHPARGGRRGGNLPENSTTSLESYTPPYSDTKENGTIIPVTPANTGAFGEIEVTVVGERNSDVDHPLPGDQDSSIDPDRHSHTTSDSKSDGHSSGTQSGANTTSAPIRRPQIPEWLIILASLLALALILAVCIAVNSRRRCGQKKKLVINNGNGKVEDRKPSGINGEASKSQEMVHLVNKEPSETPDQFMTADETRNLQNVDMKIGV